MDKNQNYIYPVLQKILQKSDKEGFLKQRAKVIWLTGLSGAGKTTIGIALERALFKKGYLTQILDGDNIRIGINSNLGFTKEDRIENIRRVAEVSKLFLNCGIITINCFITPKSEMRDLAREIIGNNNYIEVFVNAPIDICEMRDVKGLYKKARQGQIENFTGIDAPFELPTNPDIEIKSDKLTVSESVSKIINFILPQIAL